MASVVRAGPAEATLWTQWECPILTDLRVPSTHRRQGLATEVVTKAKALAAKRGACVVVAVEPSSAAQCFWTTIPHRKLRVTSLPSGVQEFLRSHGHHMFDVLKLTPSRDVLVGT